MAVAPVNAIPMEKINWTQSEDESNTKIEIVVPFSSSEAGTAKDLALSVKDEQVVVVTLKGKEMVRWRLHDLVLPDVEWTVEDNEKLILDLVKKSESSWPCLLKLPMAPTDKLLMPSEDIDALVAAEYKPLPAIADEQKAAGDDDMDKLLDEAADETLGKGEDTSNDPYVQAELKGFEEERVEMTARLRELQERLETPKEGEDVETIARHIDLLGKMITISEKIRDARSKPSTLKNFLETQMLDLRKSRINIGDNSEFESELYDSDEEREMSAMELMRKGLQLMQNNELESALHFLRLAAIHHNHATSVCLLNRIYNEMGASGRAAYFVLKRAMDDTDVDSATNLLVGEFFDRGMRHFPPLMGMAVHFYQRAAMTGSVNAMMSLAQIFTRGACSVNMSSQAVQDANKDESRFHAWLNAACDRGSGAAYFVKASLYLRGEHGVTKDYKNAKFWMDRAMTSQPEIIKRAPQVVEQLNRLRIEMGIEETKKASPTGGVTATEVKPTDQKKFPSTAGDRLGALDRQSGAARSGMDQGNKKVAAASASRRAFWEGAVKVGTACFAVYSIAFPVRVMLLPYFYGIVASVLEMFGGYGQQVPMRRMM